MPCGPWPLQPWRRPLVRLNKWGSTCLHDLVSLVDLELLGGDFSDVPDGGLVLILLVSVDDICSELGLCGHIYYIIAPGVEL